MPRAHRRKPIPPDAKVDPNFSDKRDSRRSGNEGRRHPGLKHPGYFQNPPDKAA